MENKAWQIRISQSYDSGRRPPSKNSSQVSAFTIGPLPAETMHLVLQKQEGKTQEQAKAVPRSRCLESRSDRRLCGSMHRFSRRPRLTVPKGCNRRANDEHGPPACIMEPTQDRGHQRNPISLSATRQGVEVKLHALWNLAAEVIERHQQVGREDISLMLDLSIFRNPRQPARCCSRVRPDAAIE